MVLSSSARYGVSWLGLGRSCPARLRKAWHGLIDVLRGLALYGTVLSCPVRLWKARLAKVLLWYGGAVSGPAGSSRAWFCKAWHFLARSGADGWATVERGFVWLGKVFCCIVLNGEVLFRVVKFCPAKYCYARYAEALFRRGTVGSGFARLRAVGQGSLLLRSGVEDQGSVMRGAASCGLARCYRGLVRLRMALQCGVVYGNLRYEK